MITVVVRDTPQPQGSHVAVVSKTTGHAFVKTSNEKGLKTWRGAVSEATAKARCGRTPLEGPVVLAVTFTLHKPVSTPKRKPAWPWKKPDCDKLLRSVFDALKAGGAYRDDAQVVEVLRLAKFYPLPEPFPLVLEAPASYMLTMAGTRADVLDSPGAVIRVAHLTEFLGVCEELHELGFEPKDITGGC